MPLEKQVSESTLCGALLALSGGCMDAYSYLCRGHVFANAQTGNMLLLGVNLANRAYGEAMKYFWPVLAFAAGIVLSDLMRYRNECLRRLHWLQAVVAAEAVLLLFVCFMPQSCNDLANALTSLVCGIQVETFRSIRGNSIATTMCIGNLRSGISFLDEYLHTRDRQYLTKALLYFKIILFFVIGATAESFLIRQFQEPALLLSVVLLSAVLLLMHFGFSDRTAAA